MDVRTAIPKTELIEFLHDMPGVMAGTQPDRYGIAEAFQARLAFTFLGLVKIRFQILGRGGADENGYTWAPLSPAYLAYQRPTTGRGRPLAGGLWPGGKDGMMNKVQLATWKAVYWYSLKWLIKTMPEADAKSKAAAIATSQYKEAGGKVKISDPGFGGRQVGTDYQIGVDRGILRNSLYPGILIESGLRTKYEPEDASQIFQSKPGEIIIGSSVPYATHFHKHLDGTPNRLLWPEPIPDDWMRQITDQGIQAIFVITEIARGGSL